MSTSEPRKRGRILDWLEARLNLTEIFSFLSTFGLAYGDIDTRRSLREAMTDFFTKPHPVYVRWPQILGILGFVLFVFEGVTGLFLMFYYQPTAETAYESIAVIRRDASFGWYLHQMHQWGSHFLIAILAVRLGRFFLDRAYRNPRELVWVFGVILLVLVVHEAFTGSLLPWDQQSYWSVTRGLEIYAQVPVLNWVMGFLVSGLEIHRYTLTRFYVLHVITLPAAILVFFYLHFATVRRIGLSHRSGDRPMERPMFPDHFLNLITVLLLLFGIVLTTAILAPGFSGGRADPFLSPEGILPAWYLLPAYGLVEILPAPVAGVLAAAAIVAVLLIPFLDRRRSEPGSRKWPATLLFTVLSAVVVWLGYVGYTFRG